MTDEREYVERRWGPCTASYINAGMASSYWAIRKDSDGQELCRAYCGALAGESPAWSGAREWVEERERQIDEVEEEIALLQAVEGTTAAFIASIYVAKHIKQDAAKEHPVWQRILAVEQDRLKALTIGMVAK